ncbi:hypothetical protein D9M71_672170 [compost metagenome]
MLECLRILEQALSDGRLLRGLVVLLARVAAQVVQGRGIQLSCMSADTRARFVDVEFPLTLSPGHQLAPEVIGQAGARAFASALERFGKIDAIRLYRRNLGPGQRREGRQQVVRSPYAVYHCRPDHSGLPEDRGNPDAALVGRLLALPQDSRRAHQLFKPQPGSVVTHEHHQRVLVVATPSQ